MIKLKLKILILLLLSFNNFSNARFECLSSYTHKSNLSKIDIQVTYKSKGSFNSELTTKLTDSINTTEKIIGNFIETPSKVEISIEDVGLNMNAFPPSKIYLVLSDGTYSYAAAEVTAMAIHEYGHLVFHNNLLKRKNPFETIASEWNKHFVGTDFDFSSNALDGKVLSKEKIRLDKILELSNFYGRAFDELFADVVSLLFTNNPKAISNSFKPFNGKLPHDFFYRDFSRYTLILDDVEKASPYFTLNILRGYVWNNLLKDKQDDNDFKGEFIKVLLDIFDDEIKIMAVNYEIPVSIEEVNLRIIQKLKLYYSNKN